MKISRLQIFWTIFTFLSGNMFLLTMSPAISFAKQDVWISYIIAAVFGTLIVWIASKAALLYPEHTLMEYSKLILGKWLGTLIAIIYLIQWYSVIGNILSEFAIFAIKILLPDTPPWMLLLTMLVLIIYVVFIGGLEGIGRCSEVFGPIILLSLIVLLFLSLPNLEWNRILPVLSDNNVVSILKGGLYPLSFFGEAVMMLMFLSFMDDPKDGPVYAVRGVVLTAGIVNISAIFVIMTLGSELSAKLLYPAFDLIRYINVMNFIQNLEILAILVWILSVFIKLSLYLFLASYGTARLFRVKDWRKIIWLVAIFAFVSALILIQLNIHGIQYINAVWIPYVLPIHMVGIPLLLWIVGSIRKKRSRGQ